MDKHIHEKQTHDDYQKDVKNDELWICATNWYLIDPNGIYRVPHETYPTFFSLEDEQS